MSWTADASLCASDVHDVFGTEGIIYRDKIPGSQQTVIEDKGLTVLGDGGETLVTDVIAVDVQDTPGDDVTDNSGQNVTAQGDELPDLTLTCPVSHERRERRRTEHGFVLVYIRELYVRDSDLPAGRKIRMDGTFFVGGLRYAIESLHPRIGGRTKVVLTRATRRESTRPRYRG